jgi:hypothetical protein
MRYALKFPIVIFEVRLPAQPATRSSARPLHTTGVRHRRDPKVAPVTPARSVTWTSGAPAMAYFLTSRLAADDRVEILLRRLRVRAEALDE